METVIITLLKEDMASFVKLSRLDKLLKFLRDQYKAKGLTIRFDTSFDAIERAVNYNSDVLDMIGDEIALRGALPIELVEKHQPIDELREIIESFVKENAA